MLSFSAILGYFLSALFDFASSINDGNMLFNDLEGLINIDKT